MSNSTDIKQWIASSVSSGYTLEQLRSTLLKVGFRHEQIEAELAIAMPYITAAEQLYTRLSRREKLMMSLDQQLRHIPEYLHITKTPLPAHEQFLEEYCYPNRAGLFSNALEGCTAKGWTPRNLVDKVGAGTEVQIQYGRDAGSIYEHNTAKYRRIIAFGQYIELVENTPPTNNFYMTNVNSEFNSSAFLSLRNELSDLDYLTPDSDEQPHHILIGPAGTQTLAHYDNANVMLIQVYGRKLVRLVPALQVPYMYNNTHPRSSDFDLLAPNLQQYPEFANATVIDVEIGPGDCLFIPVGWWHHITSLSTSISITTGNIRGCEHMKVFLP
ncbi:MAG TPA: cupin-like domain-containing protein [Rickettsiales bacterium]|nr:cupin-like domain-containing protein [Rickettsiales bacterium]